MAWHMAIVRAPSWLQVAPAPAAAPGLAPSQPLRRLPGSRQPRHIWPQGQGNQKPSVSLSASHLGKIKKPSQVMSSQDKPSQDMSKAQHETESCFMLGLLILDESFTWHRPIFSGGYPPNIVGATAFHSRVRDGSEWFHCAMDTRIERLGFRYGMELTTP